MGDAWQVRQEHALQWQHGTMSAALSEREARIRAFAGRVRSAIAKQGSSGRGRTLVCEVRSVAATQ